MNRLDLPAAANIHRILVVDDTPDNLFLLQTVLETEGYQVEVADSGKAALGKIAVQPPDLLLLDVMMPGINGYEVPISIRENQDVSSIPIFMITGSESEVYGVAIDGFIRKPINLEDLLNRIHAILAVNALV